MPAGRLLDSFQKQIWNSDQRQRKLSTSSMSANGSSSYSLCAASEDEAEEIMRIVNIAYEVECRVFKTVPRMLAADEFLSAYGEGRVLKAVDERGNIVGMLLQEYDHDVMHFGPLAVLPEWCGRGVGRALIYKAMEMARSKGALTVEISVINLRDELVPFYERMGFVKCGEAPYPLPERLSRPCHFVLYRKDL